MPDCQGTAPAGPANATGAAASTSDEPPRGAIERIERAETGELVAYLRDRDEPVRPVRVARCFPWSLPDSYLSIRTAEGKEICLLTSLDDLPDASRAVVEGELEAMIFNPKILRVLEWRREFGVASIRCQTDRGEVTFQIRRREDVRLLSDTRALLQDVDGNTYELPDVTQLDPASQKHFSTFF